MQFALIISLLCLLSAAWPVCELWLSFRRTALRSACCWTAIAYSLWVLHAVAAPLVWKSEHGVCLGHLRLLAATSVLWFLVAVLGARWPGAAAWNLIVFSLLVVFALPLIEQAVLRGPLEQSRVGMDGPRFAFYWVIALVGIFNYLPTRFGLVALLFAVGVAGQSVAAGPWTIASETAVLLSALANLFVSCAAWSAVVLRPKNPRLGIHGAWLRFRDSWGVVWATRFRDRWNATAINQEWPLYLSWDGFRRRGMELDDTQYAAADRQFRVMLRRFADPIHFIVADTESTTTNFKGLRFLGDELRE